MQNKTVEIKQTAKGANYKACELDDGRKVNVFSFHSQYDKYEVGTLVEETEMVKDGNYWNFKDDEAKPKTGGSKSAMMTKVMSDKREGIALSQDRKEEGIKISSCNRMATEVLTSYAERYESLNEEERLEKWRYLRSWFYNNWLITKEEVELTPPFE